MRAAADRLLDLGGVRRSVLHREWDTSGAALHYLDAGRGAPVILIHGAGGGCANWYRVIGPLAERYRVLAPDLPGFGESEPTVAHPPLGAAAAARLGAWLDATAPPPWVLVGTSFGGLAALRLAQARPEDVRALVLVDVVGLGTSLPLPVRLAARRRLAALLLRPSRPGTAILFRTLLTSRADRIPGEQRQALIDYLHAADAGGGAVQLRSTLPQFTGWRGQREVLTEAELAGLRIPALIAWGERDRFVPAAHGRRAARILPDAELRIIRGVGHSPNWEAPDELNACILRFLERLPDARSSSRG